MLLGSLAGGISAFLTCPLDVLKTRIMLTADLPANKRLGVAQTFRQLVREEGYRRLFAGAPIRVLWISLGGAIWFSAFEFYQNLFHHYLG